MMNALIAWLVDWYKRWFEFTYPVKEKHQIGGTPAMHDFRTCSKCGAFQGVVKIDTVSECWKCIHLIGDGNTSTALTLTFPRPGDNGARVFVLEKPLHNPVTSWAVVITAVIITILLTLFTPHFTGNVIPVSMTAEEWLGAGRDYLFMLLNAFAPIATWGVLILATLLVVRKFFPSRPHNRVGWSIVLAQMTTIPVVTVLGLAHPTHIFSEQHLVLSNAQVAEYFRDKVDTELDTLIGSGDIEKAANMLMAIARKYDTGVHQAFWGYQQRIGQQVIGSPHLLGMRRVREVLEREHPDGKGGEVIPALYLAYLKAGDESTMRTHCSGDPWGYITATSLERFARVIEFCKSQP